MADSRFRRRFAIYLSVLAAAGAVTLGGAPAGETRPLSAAAGSHPLLGITGDVSRFKGQTDQDSLVDQAFLGWGQGQTWGTPFAGLLPTLTPIPLLHLGTNRAGSEAITPAAIASGQGDSYLLALNRAIAVWGKALYVRPMAEMNNSGNFWSGYDANGQPRDAAHSPASYRQAFARIYLILHGGTAAAIDAKLKSLSMPPLGAGDAPLVNPFPKLRVVWSPLAGGNPAVPGNAAAQYYPGTAYVDVEGGSIYDEKLTDTAPWQGLEALYQAARGHHKPFSIPEWGLSAVDDPAFVRHMCGFLGTHGSIEMAAYYESRAGSKYDLASMAKSRQAYTDCITPLAGALPSWASANAAGAGGTAIALELTPRPASGAAPLAVSFLIAAKPAAPVTHWQLLYGDGAQTEGSGAPPALGAHRYTKDGIYQATLLVYRAPPFNPDAAASFTSTTVTVGTGATPVVKFVPSPAIGPAPLAVSFATALHLPTSPASWEILFGDGKTRNGSGAPPRFIGHTYATSGSYRVLLVVDAAGGSRFLSSATVTAAGGPGGGGGGPGGPTPPATGTTTGTVLVNGVPYTGGPIPYGSQIDVTNGTLLLKTDTGSLRIYGSGVPAVFVLLRGTDKGKPIVELRLKGPRIPACSRKTSSAATTAATPKPVRQLWGNGKGKFRTRGRYASATVRGTWWLTAERCDGTLTKVRRGVVEVRDLRLKKTVRVRAGQSYLAKTP